MNRAALIVFVKEFVDNFRDRRTLASALFFGPLFGPALFSNSSVASLSTSIICSA